MNEDIEKAIAAVKILYKAADEIVKDLELPVEAMLDVARLLKVVLDEMSQRKVSEGSLDDSMRHTTNPLSYGGSKIIGPAQRSIRKQEGG